MANDKFKNGPIDRYEIGGIGENPVSISFDENAFDDLLKIFGVRFIHYTAKRCPIGLQDKFDNRRVHDHSGCSNGFLYTKAGVLTGFFSTNKMEAKLRDTGIIDDSTAILSVPTSYEDSNKEVFISPYDRLVMLDLDARVVNWQIVEHNQTGNDRLQFPAMAIDGDIVDSNGIYYKEGMDFRLDSNGAIAWIPGGNSPGRDINLGTGTIFSVRYYYQPFWYVTTLLKELRVFRTENYIQGTNHLKRLPLQISITREYVYQISDNDPESLLPNNLRQAQAPGLGSFGPK